MLKIEKKPLAIWNLFAMQVGELTDGLSDINELEEMLFHFSKLLHPNHYILVDIMHNLVSEHTRNGQMNLQVLFGFTPGGFV